MDHRGPNDFDVELVEAGYATPCHHPVSRHGKKIAPGAEGYVKLIRLVDGKRCEYLAHRVRFSSVKGEIPDGFVPDHLCRNRWCCNSEHIESVTVAINNRRGNVAKLTAENVEEIRRLRAAKVTCKEIGKMFGVDPSVISRTARGENWSDGSSPAWERVKQRRAALAPSCGETCHL